MYIPESHEEKNLDALHALIQTYPLGTWVCMTEQGLDANHVPFILDQTRGEFGVLRAHVARANPVWRSIVASTPSLVSFHGPQSYITPHWYPSKKIAGKVVPTWNYTAVHVRGTPLIVQDPVWLLQMLSDLTAMNEAQAMANGSAASAWKVSDAPPEFINRLLGAIVGIEIPIASIEGRWKLSQDETLEDRLGTSIGLHQLATTNAMTLAALVRSRMP